MTTATSTTSITDIMPKRCWSVIHIGIATNLFDISIHTIPICIIDTGTIRSAHAGTSGIGNATAAAVATNGHRTSSGAAYRVQVQDVPANQSRRPLPQ